MYRKLGIKEVKEKIAILDYRIAWAEMLGKEQQAMKERWAKSEWIELLAELQATTKLVDTNSVVESNIYS